jgi:hypothetical protein
MTDGTLCLTIETACYTETGICQKRTRLALLSSSRLQTAPRERNHAPWRLKIVWDHGQGPSRHHIL